MAVPVVIGDEVTAAGYRLAGAQVVVPERGEVKRAFERVMRSAELVLVTADCAAELPADYLSGAMRDADPLILIVPDSAGRRSPTDLAQEADRVLGIET